MIQPRDIYPISKFKADVKGHLDRLKATGRHEVLTVNGEAAGVIMSPEAYERLLADAERSRNQQVIDQSLRDLEAGRVKDARQAIRHIARQLGLDLRR